MTGIWGLYITLIWMMYQSNYRTSLSLVSYTAPIKNDTDVIDSGKLAYKFNFQMTSDAIMAFDRYFGNVKVSLPKQENVYNTIGFSIFFSM